MAARLGADRAGQAAHREPAAAQPEPSPPLPSARSLLVPDLRAAVAELDAPGLAAALNARRLPGAHFRPTEFLPTFQKHAGTTCGGCQLHVIDRLRFRPVETAVTVLALCRAQAPDDFGWREPPYEYEALLPPIDILAGSARIRTLIDADADGTDLRDAIEAGVDAFRHTRGRYLLY